MKMNLLILLLALFSSFVELFYLYFHLSILYNLFEKGEPSDPKIIIHLHIKFHHINIWLIVKYWLILHWHYNLRIELEKNDMRWEEKRRKNETVLFTYVILLLSPISHWRISILQWWSHYFVLLSSLIEETELVCLCLFYSFFSYDDEREKYSPLVVDEIILAFSVVEINQKETYKKLGEVPKNFISFFINWREKY